MIDREVNEVLRQHAERIACLETICKNHIPHIQRELARLKALLTSILVSLVLLGAGVIADLIVRLAN